ncbi:MAG: cation:proton antiporter [Candidatus Omnitrophica bacterium]|nr:cation:proton antiporter [Candidatus Omnitrophota bacterium]
MGLVILYSVLLIGGILFSQYYDISSIKSGLDVVTKVCLAYIMLGVGLEFTIDKKRIKDYGFDFLFAFLAAALPWIFCGLYFIWFFQIRWESAFLIGVFAAPTSAGVLFAMLEAAGLKQTWVFKKAQVLAVFDDFDAILLLIPLQIIFIGFRPELVYVVFCVLALLTLAYYKLHTVKIPPGLFWLIGYGIGIVLLVELIKHNFHIDIGVLLPSFVFGALIAAENAQARTSIKWVYISDNILKALFIFLVGCSLPKIGTESLSIWILALHVLALTVLSNLGKCFLFFCYRKDTIWKDRLALSVAMFPRGEVGAGVLFTAMGYGLSGSVMNVAGLSLALNLCLTGLFIMIVVKLIRREGQGA